MRLEVDIISQITERFPALRDAEKKVAKLIMVYVDFSDKASYTELGESSQVRVDTF